MVRSVKGLHHSRIHASDGDIGRVEDFYFDDKRWTIRHIVVNTSHWLPGRRVLIPPGALTGGWAHRELHVPLTKAQVEQSPSVDTEKPVSRQHDIEVYRYFGFPYYWDPPFVLEPPASGQAQGDPHLRSAREVMGYRIHAADGEIGHVEDFLVEEGSWIIRYLVVDTRNWWPGKWVVISPGWVARVSWGEAAVHVDLDRERIRNAPPYDPASPIGRDYELRLFEYYGRPTYWEDRTRK